MLTLIGSEAGDNWENWKDSLHYVDYAVAAMIVLGAIWLFVRWRRRRKRAAAAADRRLRSTASRSASAGAGRAAAGLLVGARRAAPWRLAGSRGWAPARARSSRWRCTPGSARRAGAARARAGRAAARCSRGDAPPALAGLVLERAVERRLGAPPRCGRACSPARSRCCSPTGAAGGARRDARRADGLLARARPGGGAVAGRVAQRRGARRRGALGFARGGERATRCRGEVALPVLAGATRARRALARRCAPDGGGSAPARLRRAWLARGAGRRGVSDRAAAAPAGAREPASTGARAAAAVARRGGRRTRARARAADPSPCATNPAR